MASEFEMNKMCLVVQHMFNLGQYFIGTSTGAQ